VVEVPLLDDAAVEQHIQEQDLAIQEAEYSGDIDGLLSGVPHTNKTIINIP
jgi:hypothetical protein